MTRGRVLVVAAVLAFVACKRDKSTPKPERRGKPLGCTPDLGRELCASGDALACGWIHALDETSPDDAALRALLPALADKTLLDGEPPVPPSATYRSSELSTDPPYTIVFPVDWSADPYGKRSWRSGFLSLRWLAASYRGDGAALDVAAYTIMDWAGAALAPGAKLEWTWNDAAMARRLERLSAFLTTYLATRREVHRRVIIATVRAIATHVHAMSLAQCYAESNHGMTQDLALIRFARILPGLDDGQAIHDLAHERLVAHVDASVDDEGIHVENSPEYHVFYLNQVLDAIDVFASLGETPPPELLTGRDAMLAALVYHFQPNQTLTQFGDSTNADPERTREAVERARRQDSTAPALDELDWILSDGASGRAPENLQHVFTAGGYAMFRERWTGPQDIAAHVKFGRLSAVHDHADETSFELYGHGTELVVDTGKYSYEYDAPLVKHQYDARAHNVLIVDDAPFDFVSTGRIVDSGDGWVHGEHTGYVSRGVSVTRTFTYARPSTFTIVDRATAAGAHAYAQHFHLHPSLADVQVTDDRTVVAKIPGGASLTIESGEAPVRIDVVRGQNDAAGIQGWYFPGWERAEPTADVIFVYGTRPGPEVTFPVELTITGPLAKLGDPW